MNVLNEPSRLCDPPRWRGRAFLGMSLDGYIARLNDDVAWLEGLAPDPAHAVVESAHPALEWQTFFPSIDSLVMGRSTYEKVASFAEWPFAALPVLVLSTTMSAAVDPRITVVRSLPDAAAELDRSGATEVYVDGGGTVRSFLRADLIRELTVSIAPIVLGEGKPLFGEHLPSQRLLVRGVHSTADGLVRVTYELPAGGHA